ncbi:MAG TPA: S-adenosylmethionine:tRNA ribosyltransferase-isomerase [Flavitalea sp.]|nr:S-adenosylmethionine:tRNA ribosyltransferase-isomerase [Flavitalea sp.]
MYGAVLSWLYEKIKDKFLPGIETQYVIHMHPKELFIEDYSYHLPDHLIAKHPLEHRDASRLVVLKDDRITEDLYGNIPIHLPANSLVVINNTKVVEARLLFTKQTGGVIEIFCLQPVNDAADVHTDMLKKSCVEWKCFVGGASKWKRGQILEKKIHHENGDIHLEATYISQQSDSFNIKLSWAPEKFTFAEILHLAGEIPLPPYLKRDAEESDVTRYQTVYAVNEGSVAAPTAGLHFTNTLFDKLTLNKIQLATVTLHVGAGTFIPVKTERLGEHDMHAEWIHITRKEIDKIILNLENTIIAVGTTSLRTLETLYWIGVKLFSDPVVNSDGMVVQQWEGYNKSLVSPYDSLHSIVRWMDTTRTEELITKTKILIAPGYKFRIVNALITNFHQPRSTLIVLIAAFIGEKWKEVYEYAIEHQFRFLSYGDGCLLFRNESMF